MAQSLSPSYSRYLRARKFAPAEAFGQFKDTEDWRKSNHMEELYDTIDVETYERTRRLVQHLVPLSHKTPSDFCSIRNGQAVATVGEYPSTFLR